MIRVSASFSEKKTAEEIPSVVSHLGPPVRCSCD
jgi:hypothetical protein